MRSDRTALPLSTLVLLTTWACLIVTPVPCRAQATPSVATPLPLPSTPTYPANAPAAPTPSMATPLLPQASPFQFATPDTTPLGAPGVSATPLPQQLPQPAPSAVPNTTTAPLPMSTPLTPNATGGGGGAGAPASPGLAFPAASPSGAESPASGGGGAVYDTTGITPSPGDTGPIAAPPSSSPASTASEGEHALTLSGRGLLLFALFAIVVAAIAVNRHRIVSFLERVAPPPPGGTKGPGMGSRP